MHRQGLLFGVDRNQSPDVWLRVLVEEVGEVAKAIDDKDLANFGVECVQVAAVAMTMVEWLLNYQGFGCKIEVANRIQVAFDIEREKAVMLSPVRGFGQGASQ